MAINFSKSLSSRREALAAVSSVGAVAMLGALPGRALSAPLEMTDLHIHAARAATAVRAGRTLALKLLLPQGCHDNIAPVVQIFEQLTGVAVEIQWTPVDLINERLKLDYLLGNDGIDVALPATFGIPDLAAQDVILNLRTFAERYEPENLRKDQLYTVGDFYKGEPYGFQTDGDVYLMFYNKPWLDNEDNRKRFGDRHGYALDVARTWNELDAQMAFFHEPERQRYGGSLFRTADYLGWEWWARFHAKGGLPFDSELNPSINNELGVDALTELMSATRFQHPECKIAGLFRNWEIYAKGNVFANIGWGGTQKYLNSETSAMRGKLAFGLTPGEMINGRLNRTSYFNWGWNLAVCTRSGQQELAYLFTLFASSPEMTRLSVRGRAGYFDPFRREHYEDEEIQDIYSREFLTVHRQGMIEAMPDFYMRGHSDYMTALKTNLVHAFDAILTPKEALDAAAKAWRLISLQNGQEGQLEQWRYLMSKYPRI